MATATRQEPPSPNTDFWFDDGSIVLVVEDTAFRIHQSILDKHSDVFADPSTAPQSRKDADSIEGCPVVHLNDSLADFTDVMKALYEPFHFDKLSSEADLSTLISFVAGILRISTKYKLHRLRQKCIAVLQTKFPSTLEGCDALLASGYKYVSSTIVRAIPLARETNVSELLPWAFYISANISTDALLENPILSWRDKALCIAGKNQLWEMQKSMTHRFLFDFSKALTCQHACQSRLPQSMNWRRAEELRASPHPLHLFEDWDSLKVCAKCLELVQLQHQKGREQLWKSLPSVFHLGSWDEIQKDQNR
ncbi:hypothetical protein Hypma_008466 [Hypsizygus marmoreus]|uniref:BTB domain-containing protein n=1 Tax=Hypsizygus marmoreus TaxID=39966 RepID=A0A369JYC2_HYPMA|nr:hypothetical protein Hypma_008466 [Hypsizygus marmoreus]